MMIKALQAIVAIIAAVLSVLDSFQGAALRRRFFYGTTHNW